MKHKPGDVLEPLDRAWYVYVLQNARGEVFYVGQTISPAMRLTAHVSQSPPSVREQIAGGRMVVWGAFESELESLLAERSLIIWCKDNEVPIVNRMQGDRRLPGCKRMPAFVGGSSCT